MTPGLAAVVILLFLASAGMLWFAELRSFAIVFGLIALAVAGAIWAGRGGNGGADA